jgi:hypothetical protein
MVKNVSLPPIILVERPAVAELPAGHLHDL